LRLGLRERARGHIRRFYSDRLAHIAVSFEASNFEQVRSALIERYGKPDSSATEVVKNRNGR